MVLTREHLNRIIGVYLNSKSLNSDDGNFISCKNSKLGDIYVGFLSSQEKKTIKYKARGKEGEIHAFIKKMPEKEYQKTMTVELGTFQRESTIYAFVFEWFGYGSNYELPFPTLYFAHISGLLVIEDLNRKGYRNKNLYETLGVEECHSVLVSLSKFHAASFIVESQTGYLLNRLFPELDTDVLLNPNDNHCGKRFCLVGIKALKNISQKYMSHYPKEVVNKAFTSMEQVFKNLKSSKRYPNALSHMDLWLNNILFKYDDNGKLEDTKFVDLQYVSYKPPAFDVQFFLHNCTTKEFRDNHYHHLLKFYFNSLSKLMPKSPSSYRDEIMTWKDFENTVDETLPLVLAVTPIYQHFVLMPSNIVEDVMESNENYYKYCYEDRTPYVLQAILENENYKLRLFDSLIQLFDYCNLSIV